ncbi:[4Fe-4S] cluster assembly scaffold protein Mrp (=ApbC) [hydrothermal vent metagenome]|uniref:[4Fe-4S] cluster assembly scaffold protein Mrp (=ApbC) n=1 Tax=hydrothermal vent metagenome TaxID=652676 RepID=A0A3B0V0D8_9ZZZZ
MTQNINITEEAVLAALSSVMDPELNKDLVSAGMIKDVTVDGTRVAFTLELTSGGCPLKKELEDAAHRAVAGIDGITEVAINITARGHGQSNEGCGSHEGDGRHGHDDRSKGLPVKEPIEGIKHTIAVASGKGGVGKSTVAVNLALSLSKSGARVGLLDIDIYGPSIPMMMGVKEELEITEDKKLVPLEKDGLKLMSVGFMIDEETPLIWRGPLVMQLIQQFLRGVDWGELDYLVIDMPPGTGDAQLTLVQNIPLSGAVIVTTPQDVALIDARRAIMMFSQVEVPVLGIVENMSSFCCPHCNETTDIFSSGGGKTTAERYEVELLGKLPIDIKIREGGDSGRPVVTAAPDSKEACAFTDIAQKVAEKIEGMVAG